MRFLIDKMLSPDRVRLLENDHPGCRHVEHELGERAKDSEIWNYALENGFTILSRDRDFAGMSALRGHPPKVARRHRQLQHNDGGGTHKRPSKRDKPIRSARGNRPLGTPVSGTHPTTAPDKETHNGGVRRQEAAKQRRRDTSSRHHRSDQTASNMELPVADLMSEPQSKPRSEEGPQSIINELMDTAHSSPMQRLADVVFTNSRPHRVRTRSSV